MGAFAIHKAMFKLGNCVPRRFNHGHTIETVHTVISEETNYVKKVLDFKNVSCTSGSFRKKPAMAQWGREGGGGVEKVSESFPW